MRGHSDCKLCSICDSLFCDWLLLICVNSHLSSQLVRINLFNITKLLCASDHKRNWNFRVLKLCLVIFCLFRFLIICYDEKRKFEGLMRWWLKIEGKGDYYHIQMLGIYSSFLRMPHRNWLTWIFMDQHACQICIRNSGFFIDFSQILTIEM